MRIFFPSALLVTSCFGQVFGIWKIDPTRSNFATDPEPRSLLVRIEPHAKGEVLTLDRTERNGQVVSSSVLLYLDGTAREFQDTGCSGTQSSRRLDRWTVEILRECGGGEWIKFVRRLTPEGRQLVLEITEQRSGGRRLKRKLMFERQ